MIPSPATRLATRPAARPRPSRLRVAGGASAPALPRTAVAPWRRAVRRVFDVVVAGVALGVLAPVMAAVAVLVRCTSRGPALYKQVRLGQGRRPFVMLKFRTMYVDANDRLHREYVRKLMAEPAAAGCGPRGLYKLVDDPRVTPVGRWLRRTSLDELPQLINVLRGEMSVVGPRPVLPWEADLFGPRHAVRFTVRPGITGLWQTCGRSRLTMTEALDLDIEYVERQSLRLDLAILLRTIPAVLDREGVP